MGKGSRVTYHPYGLGTVTRLGNVRDYPQSATATVQFDSGKRYVVLAKRLREVGVIFADLDRQPPRLKP